jgi:MoaA/NifB/PqqE/SkfB family radical SAM enzyme
MSRCPLLPEANVKPITLSINPTYYCNLRCSFCYLTPEQLGDKQRLPLEVLRARIEEIQAAGYKVTHVDLYGGEVLLLPVDYLNDMKAMFHEMGIDDLVLISNLTVVNEIAQDEDYELSVSYDFTAREKSDLVFGNMLTLERTFNILTLASRELLDCVGVDELVHTFNMLTNANCVEIKPYSENQANADRVTFKEYEQFVWDILTHPDRTFYFENESLIIKAAEGKRNAFSDDHLYITPTGEFAVLDFDLNDREFFLKVKDIEAYEAWCVEEKRRVSANSFCNGCQFKGKCLSEHLRDVKSLENSCNGFHDLLVKWVNYEGAASSKARNHSRLT